MYFFLANYESDFVTMSEDENLFESSINLLGSSIFVLLSQVNFLLELNKKYT